MDSKHGGSTESGTEGGRITDAPSVSMNIAEFARQIKAEAAREKNDRKGHSDLQNARDELCNNCSPRRGNNVKTYRQ